MSADTLSPYEPEDDPGLDAVFGDLSRRADPVEDTFGGLIRRAIDEVLDGPRTGRFDFYDLEKTEKTYVGTKLEIVLRTALDFARGPQRDLEISGEPVDVKWSMSSVWMIPPESRGEIALCLGGRRKLTEFEVGLVRCTDQNVNWPLPGRGQRDKKGTLTAAGRAAMRHIVPPAPLPPNFVAAMDPAVRAAAMSEETIQRRVTSLFKQLPYTPIPRDAVRTIAMTEGDPMRRLRQDDHAGDPLDGLIVLSRADGGNAVLAALGITPLAGEEHMAISRADLARVPEPIRGTLSATARKRFRF
jgi:hypothetical protein